MVVCSQKCISSSLTTIFIDSVFLHEAGSTDLPGGHSKRVPPESISNSVVKTFRADDSAEEFRVKVGTAGHFYFLAFTGSTRGRLSSHASEADIESEGIERTYYSHFSVAFEIRSRSF